MSPKHVRCLVCGQKVKFLHPYHHEAKHDIGLPRDHEAYLGWVADKWNLPEDDEVFEPGELTTPEGWERNKSKFPNWRSKVVQSVN